ncbi:MAG TPA: TetR/AcrR family transcriptional regulator [Wenzhouxiangella sp.]|nr:TetR/AcrR family transcriptional regulator [Wenzhouxiangella sp.]
MPAAGPSTPDRILGTALLLFNAHGERHVATNRIADELGISPGNLHYHFRTKEALISTLFKLYEKRMLELLAAPGPAVVHVEDIWLFLHLVFETIGEFRFLYRDLTDICSRFPGLRLRFQAILKLSMATARQLSQGLIDQDELAATPEELDALVRNIVLISTFWIAFDQVAERDGEPRPERAAWQVMSLISPNLVGPARNEMKALAQAYRMQAD